jgi:OTU domain-containing protein 5
LIRTALRQSEESHIERAMLDDKIAATDWEATQDELIQQVARESYLQWLCDTKDNKTVSYSIDRSVKNFCSSDAIVKLIPKLSYNV